MGLLSVLLHLRGQRLQFLNPENFPEYAKYDKVTTLERFHRQSHNEGIQFGMVVQMNGCIYTTM